MRSKGKILGFERNTLNSAGLLVAGIIVALFLWRTFVVHKGPVIYYLAECIGSVIAILGIMLYLDRRSILGILLVFVHVAQIAVTRLFYSMSIVGSVYFWIFVAVLLSFVIIFLWPPMGSKLK